MRVRGDARGIVSVIGGGAALFSALRLGAPTWPTLLALVVIVVLVATVLLTTRALGHRESSRASESVRDLAAEAQRRGQRFDGACRAMEVHVASQEADDTDPDELEGN
jgi:membrane protein implicated in regulation of membrane protease activity